MVIESVAWNKAALLSSSHSTSTREILIGARNGTIYEAILDAEEDFFKSQERYLNAVYTLRERQPITGLNFDFFPSIDPKRVLIVAITTTRIYQFSGTLSRRPEEGGRVFGMIFATYREAAPSASVCFALRSQLPTNSEKKYPNFLATFDIRSCTTTPLTAHSLNRYQEKWLG
jgi:hypothetical protein